jgi:hypothetical protein
MSGADDLFEVEELRRVADWRLRPVDADPADVKSAVGSEATRQ